MPSKASGSDSSAVLSSTMSHQKVQLSHPRSLIALRRLTIIETAEGQLDMLKAEGHLARVRSSGYDIIALQPHSESSAVRAAQSGDVDVILAAPAVLPTTAASSSSQASSSASASAGGGGRAAGGKSAPSQSARRPGIRWHRAPVESILSAGIPLELRYGDAVSDPGNRRSLLTALWALRPLTRGRGAAILLSSGTAEPDLLRAPHDIGAVLSAQAGTGFGSLDECLRSQWLAPGAALGRIEKRRFDRHKGVVDATRL